MYHSNNRWQNSQRNYHESNTNPCLFTPISIWTTQKSHILWLRFLGIRYRAWHRHRTWCHYRHFLCLVVVMPGAVQKVALLTFGCPFFCSGTLLIQLSHIQLLSILILFNQSLLFIRFYLTERKNRQAETFLP